MSLENLKQSFADRELSLSAFDPFLTEGDPTPFGTADGADTSGEWALPTALGAGLFTAGAASFTWKSYMAMQYAKANGSTKNNPVDPVIDVLKGLAFKIDLGNALERLDKIENLEKLISVLPTVGAAARPLNMNVLIEEVKRAIDTLDPLVEKTKDALEASDLALNEAYQASKKTFIISASLTALGTAGTAIAAEYAARSAQFMDEDADSETGRSSLIDNAFAEFEMRTDLTLGQLDVSIDGIRDFAENLPDIDALAQLMASVSQFADPIKSLAAEIGTMVKPYEDFLGVADIMAAPINGILDFFASPPKILPTGKFTQEVVTPGFWMYKPAPTWSDPLRTEKWFYVDPITAPVPEFTRLFNPIPRSEVQKIIDMITDLAGLPRELMDKALSPILGPLESTIKKALQPVKDALDPFSDYIDDFDVATKILGDLKAIVDQIGQSFTGILDLLPDIDFELNPIAEIGVFDGDGMATFLGQETDEKLVGVKSALSSSVMGGAILQGNGGHDDITGTTDNDLLGGGTGDDVIKGLAGDDVIFGNEGDDTIDGGTGSDVISGGTGYDIALYLTANQDEFEFVQNGNEIEITSPDGSDVDIVTGIEEFRFKDGNVRTTDLFPDIVTDPVKTPPNPTKDETLDLSIDPDTVPSVFTGGQENDVLHSGAVRAAFLSGGLGADTFEFRQEVRNGVKEIDVVEDFEIGVDRVRLMEGDVAEIRQTSGGLVLILEDDGDAIYLRNQDLDLLDGQNVFELA